MSIENLTKLSIILLVFVILANVIKKVLNPPKKSWRGRMPYHNRPILTKPEYKFYLALKPVMDERGYIICPKVRLKDLFEINAGEKNRMKYFSQISQKHVDFVVCDSKLNPLFAIELDDISHNRKEVKAKDYFKDNLFKSASNYPLYRVHTKNYYSKEYIEKCLNLQIKKEEKTIKN